MACVAAARRRSADVSSRGLQLHGKVAAAAAAGRRAKPLDVEQRDRAGQDPALRPVLACHESGGAQGRPVGLFVVHQHIALQLLMRQDGPVRAGN